jgi:pimeloyl-ACP methyl ester carboxylesterase
MAPLAVRLARAWRVFAVDLPGFGLSEKRPGPLTLDTLADSLAGWMVAEGIGRAPLIGNSFGCQILVRFALRHPGLVSRLVLQGPTGDPRISIPRLFVRWLREGTREPFSLNGILVRDYLDCGLRNAVRAFVASVTDSFTVELPHVAVPTLVLCGGRDAIASRGWCEEIAALLPKGNLAVVPRAAHTMNYASPDEFAAAVAPFLRDEGSPRPTKETHECASIRG